MKKRLFLIPTVFVGMSLIACGSNPPPAPDPVLYDVTLGETQAIELDATTATKDQDYNANLKVKDLFRGYCKMPDELIQITVNKAYLEEGYAFNKVDDNNATIHIDAQYVQGAIEITLQAIAESGTINFVSAKDDSSNDIYNFSKLSYTYGDDINGFINLESGQEKYYDLPSKGKVTITTFTDENEAIDITEYCTYDDKTGKLYIPAIYNDKFVIGKNVKIGAEQANRPEYTNNTFTSETLELDKSTNEDLGSIKKGQEFSFVIKVKSSAGEMITPDYLNITVGSKKLQSTEYEITRQQGSDGKIATVKIYKGKIDADVTITGEAKDLDQYEVELDPLGIGMEGDTYAKKGQNYVATIKVSDGHIIPANENVVVKLPGNDWQSLAHDVDGCIYKIADDKQSSTLTINGSKITGPIAIAAKAADIDLLKFMTQDTSWDEVRTASAKGYAYYLFNIGEESSPFEIDSKYYQARLIGIDRDSSKSMTFEFTTCIDTAQPFGKVYNLNSYYYRDYQAGISYESALREYLNTTLINKLPFKNNIANTSKKTVIGKYGTGLNAKKDIYESAANYLFPLSLSELGYDVSDLAVNVNAKNELPTNKSHSKDVNGPYEYYQDASQSKIKQAKINGTLKDVKYWTRTPYLESEKAVQTYIVKPNGEYSTSNCRPSDVYVAPAFCM